MSVPSLSHLQFLALGILRDGEKSGRLVREKLAELGELKSGPGFYQFMGRLEESGLVEGWYHQEVIGGHAVKERRYRISGQGIAAWEEVRDFYLAHAGLGYQGA